MAIEALGGEYIFDGSYLVVSEARVVLEDDESVAIGHGFQATAHLIFLSTVDTDEWSLR